MADTHPVNPGEATTLRWNVERADLMTLSGPGIVGSSVDVTGLTSYDVTVTTGADYTLQATNDFGSAYGFLEDVGRNIPATSFLIAGQSNARGINVDPSVALTMIDAESGVRMFGNDYVWQQAYEPLDDCTGQVDEVSMDPTGSCVNMGSAGVSLGVSLGNEVHAALGGAVFLIPAAKGGSSIDEWTPGADAFDRSTLFGSASYRAREAKRARGAAVGHRWDGATYGGIVWYQGESDTHNLTEAQAYKTKTNTVFYNFQQELGAPIIFAQLGRIYERSYETGRNLLMQVVRDAQRNMESPAEMRFLVVTHDLAMADRIHLSAEGQIELGRRVSLAFREWLQGEVDVDGTGPRLLRVQKADDSTVIIHFDRAISSPASEGSNAYSSYFSVFAGDTQLAVESIVRGSGDAGIGTAVVITLVNPVTTDIDVRYLPPKLASDGGAPMLLDVVRSESCGAPMPSTGVCLPAPAFGTTSGATSLESLQFFDFESW